MIPARLLSVLLTQLSGERGAHEDIDQVFSLISKHFRRLPPPQGKDPQSFLAEAEQALASKFVTHIVGNAKSSAPRS